MKGIFRFGGGAMKTKDRIWVIYNMKEEVFQAHVRSGYAYDTAYVKLFPNHETAQKFCMPGDVPKTLRGALEMLFEGI